MGSPSSAEKETVLVNPTEVGSATVVGGQGQVQSPTMGGDGLLQNHVNCDGNIDRGGESGGFLWGLDGGFREKERENNGENFKN